MKSKFVNLYIDIAKRIAELSHARRLKVGAVVVKDHRILSYGYNGMPAGFDNNCEEEMRGSSGGLPMSMLVTKPEVIHAEVNAIAKIARHGDSCDGAAMFLTHAPCVECAKMICQSGINSVYYSEEYRSSVGIELLQNANITCERV